MQNNNNNSVIMKLSYPWYDLVKADLKKAEIRIYDEKRKSIKIGDTITFVKSGDENKLTEFIERVVKGISVHGSFVAAIKSATVAAVAPNIPTANPKHMAELIYDKIYSPSDVKKYGVVCFYFE